MLTQSNLETENDDFLIDISDGDDESMIMDSLGIEKPDTDLSRKISNVSDITLVEIGKPGSDISRNISNVSDITLKADAEDDGEVDLEPEIVMDSVNRNPNQDMN